MKRPVLSSDFLFALAVATQAGAAIAGPVLLALLAGWLLDSRLGTLPWITLLLTFVAAIGGPIIAYRMVTTAVAQRMASDDEDDDEEEKENQS